VPNRKNGGFFYRTLTAWRRGFSAPAATPVPQTIAQGAIAELLVKRAYA
jgi:hypothetical protein